MVSPLSAIDASVKAHEWSHLLTLGPYAAGPIQYDFVIDSEGNRYAVGGAVPVDLSPVPGNPEATARKARAVMQAAYAPGNPSGADLRVAQKAYILLREAEEELKSKAMAEATGIQPVESAFTPSKPTARANAPGEKTTTREISLSGEAIMSERGTWNEKIKRPAWMDLYAPNGEQSSWYDFWFEREDSQNRGVRVSLWI